MDEAQKHWDYGEPCVSAIESPKKRKKKKNYPVLDTGVGISAI
jgi:hypothetical protein